jgi:hypothetical protein
MTEFKPYADDALSLQVAGITLENQTDRIALYGQIDLTRDQQGLAHAQQLKTWLDAIVTTLAAQTLPERIQNAPIETVDNPFAAE